MVALSHLGLQAIGWIEIAAPIFMLLLRRSLEPFGPPLHRSIYLQDSFLVLLGVATIAAVRIRRSQKNARLFVLISVGLATFGTCASILVFEPFPGSDHYTSGKLAVMMLVTAAAGVLRPVQMLSLGFWIEAVYVACTMVGKYQRIPAAVLPDAFQFVFVLTMSLLCTALTALLYLQRVSNYRAHQQALRATQELCMAQSRALVSENAAAMAKLAATLSHELNSPIGALTSAAESLVALAAKQRIDPTEEQRRVYSKIEASLERAVREGAQRLREISGRIQRLTNIEDEKSRSADIVERLRDVAALSESQSNRHVRLELDFHRVPRITCRPQQLSAVFSHLLSNAMNSTNGDGRVSMSAFDDGAQIQVRIQDNGRGIPEPELATIFEPGFRVSEHRVAGGHWSLFSDRHIIREHGGEIKITSAEGIGTTVTVSLPYAAQDAPVLRTFAGVR